MDRQLGEDWIDHKANQRAADQAERSRNAEMRESRARAAAAGNYATKLTEMIGYQRDEGMRGTIYDSRISSLVQVGKLPDISGSENKHCFAGISVYYDYDTVERTIKGLFFKKAVNEKVKSDRVNEISVYFFAANEDGSDLENFASSKWSIAGADTIEAISAVEEDLSMIAELVGYKQGAGAEM